MGVEYHSDPFLELTVAAGRSGGDAGDAAGHAPGQLGEQQRVGLRPRAMVQDRVVAGDLAFEGKPLGNPPHGRVEEEDGLDEALGQIGPIVPPAHVSQLVPQDLLGLRQARLAGALGRQDNHRTNPSQQEGGSMALGHVELDCPAHCQFRAETLEKRFQAGAGRARGVFDFPQLINASGQETQPRPGHGQPNGQQDEAGATRDSRDHGQVPGLRNEESFRVPAGLRAG
jgi:hypothetical protein